jgi:hypothetical protein
MMPNLRKGNNAMARRLKLLIGLSTAALAGALATSGCGGEGEGEGSAAPEAGATSAHHGEAEGGEAEGEAAKVETGGEAEGAALAGAATDKAAYLSGLQIVRGHLRAGVELYALGDREIGPRHLRHPQAEILTSLAPAFAAHDAPSIEPALEALASAGEAGAAPAELSALEAAALKAIAAARDAAEPSLKDHLLAAAKSLTVAGDEFAIAAKEGSIVNLHEYHDAYGFIGVVIDDLKALKGANEIEEQAIATALDQALIARTAAPAIAPPSDGLKPASVIYGAAARVEIAARGL